MLTSGSQWRRWWGPLGWRTGMAWRVFWIGTWGSMEKPTIATSWGPLGICWSTFKQRKQYLILPFLQPISLIIIITILLWLVLLLLCLSAIILLQLPPPLTLSRHRAFPCSKLRRPAGAVFLVHHLLMHMINSISRNVLLCLNQSDMQCCKSTFHQ